MSISDKMSKREAGYVATTLHREKCRLCTMYQAGGTCSLVRGPIDPYGWCTYYEPVARKVVPFARA